MADPYKPINTRAHKTVTFTNPQFKQQRQPGIQSKQLHRKKKSTEDKYTLSVYF